MRQKFAILSNFLKNEYDPKVHYPLDDQYHSKACHLPQNKNLSMRLHYDLCRTSFFSPYNLTQRHTCCEILAWGQIETRGENSIVETLREREGERKKERECERYRERFITQ